MKNLIERIRSQFPKTEPPPTDQITNHECPSCRRIREGLSGVKWWEAEPELIRNNYDSLPFFTNEAFHYFFPAYMINSLSDFDPNNWVLEFTVYSLSLHELHRIRDEMGRFSKPEKLLVLEFLDAIINSDTMIAHHPDAQRARGILGDILASS